MISCLFGELEIDVEEGGDHDCLRAVWTIREGEREDSNDEEALCESLRYFYKRADGELFQFALRDEHEDIVIDAMSEHVAPVSGTKTVLLEHLACREVLEILKNEFEEEEETSGGQNVSFCDEDTVIDEGTCGEMNDLSDKEPTNVPSQEWTAKERKWFETHWSFDLSGQETQVRGTEGELYQCFGFLPTNEPSRKWTPGESDWYSTHWTLDHVAMNGRCGRHNGNSVTDKSISGEYVLGRPPKKPGGWFRTWFFLLILWIAVGSVECKKEEDDSMPGEAGKLRNYCDGKIFLIMIGMGIVASRRKLCELCKIFLIGLLLAEPYECALKSFAEGNGMEQLNCRTARTVLWERLVRGTLYMEENDLISFKEVKEDPEARVTQFFMRVEKEIAELLAHHSCHQKNVLRMYILSLHKSNKSKGEPVLKMDAYFYYLSFWVIIVTGLDSWRGHFVFYEQIFDVIEWFRLKLICICKILAVKLFLHILWDNRRWALKNWKHFEPRFGHIRAPTENVLSGVWCVMLKRSLRLSLACWQNVVTVPKYNVLRMARGIHACLLEFRCGWSEKWSRARRKVVQDAALCSMVIVTFLLNNSRVLMGGLRLCWLIAGSYLVDCIWSAKLLFRKINLRNGVDRNQEGNTHDERSGARPGDCRTEDDNTATTAAETLEEIDHVVECLSASSVTDLEGGGCNWSIMVNGTRYFGHLRSEGKSRSSMEKMEDSQVSPQGETVKERNRRLLRHDRAFRQHVAKVRGKKCKRDGKLQAVKEEEVTSIMVSSTAEGDHGSREGEPEEKEEFTWAARRRDIVSFLRKRTKLSRNTRRFSSDYQGAKAARRMSPSGKVVSVKKGATSAAVVEIIQLYSCSASRYLMFGSNRRYKPGD